VPDAPRPFTIGILGAGRVGGALGRAWAGAGHAVVYGEVDPDAPRVRDLVAAIGPRASVTDVARAARAADVVVLAVPWNASAAALEAAAPHLAGKVLVDVINPLTADLSGLDLDPGGAPSAAETTARRAPGARVVKAFNTIACGLMGAADFPAGRAAGLYCGDDPEARRTVARLVAEAGFEPLDAGPLAEARTLEALALVWIRLVVTRALPGDAALGVLRKAPTPSPPA
jgi:predicted dinucleotide-binding enzyme